MHGYIDRQKSPIISRKCDPGFNSVGVADAHGNRVEIQVNTTLGKWFAVTKFGRTESIVAEGFFPAWEPKTDA